MNDRYPFVNTPLPYPFDALEPYIDARTMELHHDRHLQAYIDNLNALLAAHPPLQSWTLERLVRGWQGLPPPLRELVRRNAGGVHNHRFYFDGLCGNCTLSETGRMAQQTAAARFGGMAEFEARIREAGLSVFGSGYAWLVLDHCRLEIVTTANQDTPLHPGIRPILNVDVWEHAYYLKHQNRRADYLADWLQVINWDRVGERMWECARRAEG